MTVWKDIIDARIEARAARALAREENQRLFQLRSRSEALRRQRRSRSPTQESLKDMLRSESPLSTRRGRSYPEATGSGPQSETMPRLTKRQMDRKFKPPGQPKRGRSERRGTPATPATPFAKGTLLAKVRGGGEEDLEEVSVAEFAADAKRVPAAADAQCKEDDPLGLQQLGAVSEKSSSDEEERGSSSDEDMDQGALTSLLQDPTAAAAAVMTQRRQRKLIGKTAPAPPHSMVAAARHAAQAGMITIVVDEPVPPST